MSCFCCSYSLVCFSLSFIFIETHLHEVLNSPVEILAFGCLHGVHLGLVLQIRTEEMDLIAERGIAAHYSGKVLVNGLVGHVISSGRSSRGKTICLNNANVALRVKYLFLFEILLSLNMPKPLSKASVFLI